MVFGEKASGRWCCEQWKEVVVRVTRTTMDENGGNLERDGLEKENAPCAVIPVGMQSTSQIDDEMSGGKEATLRVYRRHLERNGGYGRESKPVHGEEEEQSQC